VAEAEIGVGRTAAAACMICGMDISKATVAGGVVIVASIAGCLTG
jgi:hypothetical protein